MSLYSGLKWFQKLAKCHQLLVFFVLITAESAKSLIFQVRRSRLVKKPELGWKLCWFDYWLWVFVIFLLINIHKIIWSESVSSCPHGQSRVLLLYFLWHLINFYIHREVLSSAFKNSHIQIFLPRSLLIQQGAPFRYCPIEVSWGS